MRTHRAKSGYLPPSIFRLHFWLEAPSPFCAGSSWGLLSRKIFFDFYFSYFRSQSKNVCIEIIFWILHSLLLHRIFFSWLRSYSDSYSILFRISVVLTHYKFSLDILLVWFRYIFLDYNFDSVFFDSIFRLVFTRINFALFQHYRFYALTLQIFISLTFLLVINKHLCLCKVCFMLILAILRLSDVFSFVLGVVYRLGLK